MKYTKAQFLKDVAAEAKALKKNATKKELEKLNFYTLNANHSEKCIYGQQTGNCRSKRAVKLITLCCKKFVQNEGFHPRNGFDAVVKSVNGETSESPQTLTYLSSIETYILLPRSKRKNLIAYLRGERKDLVL